MKDKLIELIKEWRAESKKHWNIIPSIAYDKCADQLEKLIREVSDKSKT